MTNIKTYPNQRTVKINREEIKNDFLGIKNTNWMAAAKDLSASALKLYMYFASNKNGFSLALSPKAIENQIGMARSTYCDQFKILLEKGYLVHAGGNTYEFYEVPKTVNQTPADGFDVVANTAPDAVNVKEAMPDIKNAADDLPCPSVVSNCTGEDREINNINTVTDNMINNSVTNNDQKRRKEVSSNGERKEFRF